MSDKQVLHRAEEHSQSRELKTSEIKATTAMAAIESLALAGAAGIAVVIIQGIQGHDIGIWTALATGGVVGGLSFYLHVAQNFSQLREGLRAWRSVEAFAPGPGLPQPKTDLPHSPVLIRAGDRREYLDRADEPLALPSPERQRLELTPKTVSVILKEIVERHGGQWSRARIMGVRVDGQSVPRRIYEQLTDALTRADVLRERSQGGYEFCIDVKTLDDLAPFFPGLPGLTGPAGGQAGGPEQGGFQETHQVGGAERARSRWLAEQEVSGGSV